MLQKGIYYKKDKDVMQWLKQEYKEYNIPDKITSELNNFVNSLSYHKHKHLNRDKLFEFGKAIRQDIKKMLLSMKMIYEYSKNDRSNNPLFYVNDKGYLAMHNNEDKDIIQMQMEYFITKYRVIVEYTANIICQLIKFDKDKYKSLYPNKVNKNNKLILKNFEIKNLKIDYFEKIVMTDNKIDKSRFDAIRRIRNDVIHNGASCLIFDGEELLFQIYDLNVDEIICANEYLSNGNAVSCKYFMATNIAYLVYYLNKVFSALLNDNIKDDSSITYCSKAYEIDEKEESEKYSKYLQEHLGMTFDNISDTQKCLMRIIDEYCEIN